MWRVSFVAVAPLALVLLAQGLQSKPQHDANQLVVVSVKPDSLQIRPGDDLGVEVTITAGPNGAYVPNFFGDWI